MNLRAIKRRGEHTEIDVDPDAPRDEGFSLVEVVITIVLIGIIVIPLMVASATSVTASSRTREAAETETVLQNAADRVNRASPQCPNYDAYIKAALSAKGWDPSLVTADYEYYKPGSSVLAATPGTWLPGACPAGGRTAMMIQRVTITILSPSHQFKQTIRVIKNDV